MAKFVITSLLLLYSLCTIAQSDVVSQLKFYADVTANGGLAETRIEANEELTSLFEEWISSEDFDMDSLSDITYLSVKIPEDKSFAITTWQLKDGNGVYHYSGYTKAADGKVHKLNSEHPFNPADVAFERLEMDQWYGALYYNMMKTVVNGKDAYLLFGFDGHEGYEHRKIVDVLTFEDGKPVFGAEIFKEQAPGRTRPTLYSRLLLEYTNDANVSLNYSENLGMITHDHLISRMGRNPGQGPTMVPDGSYIGFKWDGTYWNYIDKLYDQVSSVPPTDGRKRETGKSITGEKVVPRAKKKRE